jgi:methyl-accepting chemotaxis protein
LIDSTTISLRATVSQVTQAAAGIDQTAHEINEVVEGVRLATQGQTESVQEVTAAVQGIDENVQEIAGSARALASSSEESSRTISELSVAGDQLNNDAQSFAQRVEHVSISVEGMVGMIEQVADGTEELASAADETSSSMEESVASVRAMEENVAEMAHLSEEVVQSAEGGQLRVNETIEGIEKIREATDMAQGVIRNLGEKAGEIGSILNVITDVADETNLLALNASIIAAQAGENGRAFSVVADEINELADRVLQHTKEIAEVIHGLQSLSESAITAIETGTQSVSIGVERSAQAGEALATIMQTTRDAGQRTSEILSSVEEQSISAKRNLELMAHVRDQVNRIRIAEREQTASTQAIRQDALEMAEISRNISTSVGGHARATMQIQETIENVSAATGQIDHALEEQTESCGRVVDFMAAVHERTRSNERSVVRLQEAMQALLSQAVTLRTNVSNFKLGDES